MTAFPGTITFDEYGRPFIILRDQEKQKRITGIDAIKVIAYLFNNNLFSLSGMAKDWKTLTLNRLFLDSYLGCSSNL